MNPKYWFISFTYYKKSVLLFANLVIDIHPIEWVDKTQGATIMFYRELDDDEIKVYKKTMKAREESKGGKNA
jgi:hypothetical protein